MISIMNESQLSIPVDMDREEVGHLFENYNLNSACVVDKNNKLVGMITSDDILTVLKEEAEEDVLRLAGVGDGGTIWMLCTPEIHRYPITFAREAKRYVDNRPEDLLCNIVDCRNTVHLKLLKFLGSLSYNFKILLISLNRN